MLVEATTFFPNGEEPERKYFNDNGELISETEYLAIPKRALGDYECPNCGRPTFGRFEPLYPIGIDEVCMHCKCATFWDRQAFNDWMKDNPELAEELSIDTEAFPEINF